MVSSLGLLEGGEEGREAWRMRVRDMAERDGHQAMMPTT